MIPTFDQFIESNLPFDAVPFVPEIRLHKAGPRSGLRQLAEADANFLPPYWAHYWKGGLALARFILDHPDTVAGRRVLDLGCGSGLVALAAAYAGAGKVAAVDVDPYAVAATAKNARANGLEIETCLGDLTQHMPPPVDVVTVGDLFYDRDTAERVTAFLQRCAAQDRLVLIGDPWRTYLPGEAALEEIASYSVSEFTGAFSSDARPSTVFTLKSRHYRRDSLHSANASPAPMIRPRTLTHCATMAPPTITSNGRTRR